MRQKPPSLLEFSPKGTVPVLVLANGEGVIEQSLEIMIWALEQSDPQHWLSADRESTLKLIHENDGSFKKNLDRYKYPEREGRDSAEALSLKEEARSGGLCFLQLLEQQLEFSASDFLFGMQPSLADIAIFPFVRQFANVDSAWFELLEGSLPRLLSWLKLCLKLEVFEAVMFRIEPWKEGDAARLWGRFF